MKILKMHATFGRLHEQELELAPGMNIIHGANESGKSTWSAFLRVMLYGISTREKSKIGFLADKEKYAPWSGAPMYGKIEFEWQGKTYSMTRRANRAGILQKAEIVEIETGLTLDIPEPVGETLLGVRREVFERSAFIAQTQLLVSSDKTGELERRITALSTTGEEDVSQKQVIERLEKWQRKLKYNKKGELPEISEQIDRLEQSLDEARADAERLTAYHTRLETLNDMESQVEGKINLAKAFAAQAELDYIIEIEQKSARLDERAAQLAKARPLSSEQCLQMKMKQERIFEQKRKCEEDKKQLELERAKICDDKIDTNPIRQVLPSAACALVALLALFFVQPIIAVVCAVCVFVLAYVLFTGIFCKKNGVKSRAELKEKIDENNKQIQKVQLLEETVEKEITKCKQEQALLLAAVQMIDASFTEDDVESLICAAEQVEQELDETRAEAAKMRARFEEAIAGRDREALSALAAEISTDAERPCESADQLVQQLESYRAEREQINTTIAVLKERIAARGELGAIENELSVKRELLTQKQIDLQAVTLAIETMNQIQTEMQRRFAPMLEKRAGELFSEFTGGHFGIVHIENAEFALNVCENDASPSRQVLELSQGTADELYLALRLALCETVLPEGTPIVLDDALVNFDDERMERVLQCLEKLSKTRQIILLTCHTREISFAQANGMYTKVLC